MDRPGVRKVTEKNREKMEETGCEIICGAPTTPAVKRLMMMMMMIMIFLPVIVLWLTGLKAPTN